MIMKEYVYCPYCNNKHSNVDDFLFGDFHKCHKCYNVFQTELTELGIILIKIPGIEG